MNKDGKRMQRRIAKVAVAAVLLTAFGATGTADAAGGSVRVVYGEDGGGDYTPQVAGIRWR